MLLDEISKSGKLFNIKFMTMEEFKNNYFGKPKNEAIYFLMKKYGLNYDVAQEYLSNIFYDYDFIKPYYDDLVGNDLIEYNLIFKDFIRNVVCFYSIIDPLIKDVLDSYDACYINFEKGNFVPKVYSFESQLDEVVYVASDIVRRLENTNINDIYLVVPSTEYYDDISRVFKWFNIPINIYDKKSIYGTNVCDSFLEALIKTKDIEKALESIEKGEIYNKIVDILNSYSNLEIDDTMLEIIKSELRRASVSICRLSNAVNIADVSEMNGDKYYYLLGFNQGVIPSVHHDDKLIKDSDRKKIGLLTSYEKLSLEKSNIINRISNTKNLIITYKLKDNYSTYFPSSLIDELNLEVLENPKIKLGYSNLYNKLYLGNLLDRYYKYNEDSNEISILTNTYKDTYYRSYDNKFTGIEKEKLYNYLGDKINLSYSSLNNYFHCAFRYYINNILKLDPYEETFSIMLGNLFHVCLSHMYDSDFNLKKEYYNFLSDKTLTSKETFFVNKLYKDLEFIVETIKKHDSLSLFNKVYTEKYIGIEKQGKIKIKFLGFVDKIKYKTENDRVLCAIIDYKTGAIKTSLDNINYGFNLQLPVYIYLADKAFDKKVEVVGFYLQKLLSPSSLDKDELDESNLRLEGYSLGDEKVLKLFDSSYEKSDVIKGMSVSKSGFSRYSKVLSADNIDKIRFIVNEKIDEIIDGVENARFDINPKRIDENLIGCEFCMYRDLCFRKEEDIVNLKYTKLNDILNEGD